MSKTVICISNYNRPEVLYKSLEQHLVYLPPDSQIFVVDDGSDDKPNPDKFIDLIFRWNPSGVINYYPQPENKGIATIKNKCLELAYNWGADHIYLFDSDTFPIAKDWNLPYEQSKEPHLMFQFKLPNKPKTDMQELYRDDEIAAYTHTRGAMIYIERRVLDVVGGFDTRFHNSLEHPAYSWRIFNAGLTSHRAADVVNSHELLYCMDMDGKVETSIKTKKPNQRLYRLSKTSKEYRSFK